MTNTSTAAPIHPGRGEMFGCSPDRPDYLTCPDRTPAWMYKRGQRVRFYDANANMVGPEHRHVAAAIVWAAMNSWWIVDQSANFNAALYVEVRTNQVRDRGTGDLMVRANKV